MELDRYHWLSYPLERKPGRDFLTRYLAPEIPDAPNTEDLKADPSHLTDSGREKIRPETPRETQGQTHEDRSAQSNQAAQQAPPAVRERVFSSELKNLAGRVLAHSETKPRENLEGVRTEKDFVKEPEPVRDIQLKWNEPEKPPLPEDILKDLFRVYKANSYDAEDYRRIMEFLRERSGARGAVCLLLDQRHFVYRIALCAGLDSITKANLYFALHDKYLGTDLNHEFISFRKLDHDYFFKKRFSSEFFQGMEGALFINLSRYGFPGYFTLFFSRFSDYRREAMEQQVLPTIRDLIPLMRRFEACAWKNPEENTGFEGVTARVYRSLKEISCSGKDQIKVIQVRFQNVLEHESYNVLKRRLRKILQGKLGQEERILLVSPDRIIVLLKSGNAEEYLDMIDRYSSRAKIDITRRVLVYPDEGYNLYNYF